MTSSEKNLLYTLYQKTKVKLNHRLDRIMDACGLIFTDDYQLPWTLAQNGLRKMARFAGDASWLLKDFPRLPAYKLVGTERTIVFVGSERILLEMQCLFFSGKEVTLQEMGRVTLWHLPTQIGPQPSLALVSLVELARCRNCQTLWTACF